MYKLSKVARLTPLRTLSLFEAKNKLVLQVILTAQKFEMDGNNGLRGLASCGVPARDFIKKHINTNT
jgi:hypothetical protein